MRRRRPLRLAALVLVAVLAAGCGGRGAALRGPSRPTLGAGADESDAADGLGFPGFATKNTTRVGGSDPVADAAAVSRAVFPATSASTRPRVVALADASDWR